jgi:hypothetical protein
VRERAPDPLGLRAELGRPPGVPAVRRPLRDDARSQVFDKHPAQGEAERQGQQEQGR